MKPTPSRPRPLDPIRDSYDRLAVPYAAHLADELAGKPLDRELLDRFAARVRSTGGIACDLGCGPGHVARYLHERGAPVCGVDLSPGMLEQARRLHPGLDFFVGDLFALPVADAAWSGVVAFYSLVHIAPPERPRALREILRVLRPGAPLLAGFHVGDEELRPGELWGVPIELTWYFLRTCVLAAELREVGFRVDEIIERDPYEGAEHPTRRGYVLASRPE
ncbi:MAG: class I SAM-dependent methyltransferase [Polyangia bacterium]